MNNLYFQLMEKKSQYNLINAIILNMLNMSLRYLGLFITFVFMESAKINLKKY